MPIPRSGSPRETSLHSTVLTKHAGFCVLWLQLPHAQPISCFKDFKTIQGSFNSLIKFSSKVALQRFSQIVLA